MGEENIINNKEGDIYGTRDKKFERSSEHMEDIR